MELNQKPELDALLAKALGIGVSIKFWTCV